MNIISDSLFTDEKKKLCCLLIDHYPVIFSDVNRLVRPPQPEMTDEEKTAKVG